MFLRLVLAFILFCATSAQLLPPLGIRRVRPGLTIQTNAGPIQGQEEIYDFFGRIYTYKGIRYAQPPVGNLRFRQGVPIAPWVDTFQAWNYGSVCPQFTFMTNIYRGEEDCLFLNIFTPTNIRTKLPVVVWIHGGGLQFGSGEVSDRGPEYFIQEGAIFVSFNYRLNVLGFLNTWDEHAPGNYGLKDMIMVLQWVQNNIEYFGGNRDDVTIFGISGGSIGVHSLVLSQAASGLFHKAISHSGSLFNGFAFNQNPVSSVQMLVRNLELQVANNTDLMNQLRQVSTRRLLNAAELINRPSPSLITEMNFMPSVDAFQTSETRVILAPPSFLARLGMVNRVPLMIGYNSFESMYAIPDVRSDPTVLERFNMNPHLLVPTEWNLAPGSVNAQEVITAFRNLYFFGVSVISQVMAVQWAQYVSDREFIFGMSKHARMHAVHQPVYYYRFDYSGSMNFIQRNMGLSEVPGTIHGDDAYYLFRENNGLLNIAPNDEALTVQRRYVRLLSNFFLFSNPTPTLLDSLIDTRWPRMTEQEEFMNINNTLTSGVHPFKARMDVWHEFDSRFNP